MKIVLFTDLDGTLLDHSTYSFEAALPALQLLKEKGVPLIICSSKTKAEIVYLREKLDNHHPFISENGGGIFIPKECFDDLSNSRLEIKEEGDYRIIRLGASYSDLRKAVMELRREDFAIQGFGDMDVEEVSRHTGLDLYMSKLAKDRDFDEPFVFNGDEEKLQALIGSIKAKGFFLTQGRFFHILGRSDKGKALSILMEIYRREFPSLITVAMGDSPNDIPMLERVDYPVVVKQPYGNYDPRINMPGLIKADGIGPQGWNQAVLDLLRVYGKVSKKG